MLSEERDVSESSKNARKLVRPILTRGSSCLPLLSQEIYEQQHADDLEDSLMEDLSKGRDGNASKDDPPRDREDNEGSEATSE